MSSIMNSRRPGSAARDKAPLGGALRALRTAFLGVGVFSFAVNILMLTGPMFMLQVYNRVLSARSVPTLLAFFSLVVVLYLFLGVFDFLRSRVLSRSGYWLDQKLGPLTFRRWVCQGTAGRSESGRPI